MSLLKHRKPIPDLIVLVLPYIFQNPLKTNSCNMCIHQANGNFAKLVKKSLTCCPGLHGHVYFTGFSGHWKFSDCFFHVTCSSIGGEELKEESEVASQDLTT